MKVLLDTHTLIWATMFSKSVSETAVRILEDEVNEIYVSSASAWEIATKVRLGKLPVAVRLSAFSEVMEIAGYTLLSIDAAHALRARAGFQEHIATRSTE